MRTPLIRRLARISAATALGLALGGALLAAPTSAQACGGLFCNSAQPVTQSAERILFARQGDTMHMLVKLTYEGPPIDFGWLLPVPADVTSRIGSAALFDWFDAVYAPRFQLNQVFDDSCAFFGADGGAFGGAGGAGGGGGEGGGGEPPVQIISREVVGPYDQVVLRAENVDELQTWLTDNGFQFPAGAGPTLQGYLDMGSAVLALKLVASATDDDVVPIHLSFTSDTPAIPLKPTAVAAQPDMGILVHLLGPARAIPTNYRHVIINEAAIDWQSAGANYADVVSQAADEAGGQAFVTDSALRSDSFPLQVPSIELVALARMATNLGELTATGLDRSDADIGRLVGRHFTPPEGVTTTDYLNCPPCYDDDWSARAFDGEAFAADLESEVAESRRILENLFLVHPYITRLFTTMSAAEMAEDPIFAFNPDLEDVSNFRSADQIISCPDGSPDFTNTIIQTADGQRIPTGAGAPLYIQRQNGQTVRGQDTRAASVVERMFISGQPELIEAYTPEPNPDGGAGGAGGAGGGNNADAGAGASVDGDGDGCGCNVSDEPFEPTGMALLLGLLGLARRRRRG